MSVEKSTHQCSSRPRRKSTNYNASIVDLERMRTDSFFANEKGYSAFGRRRPEGQRHRKKKKTVVAKTKPIVKSNCAKQKSNLLSFWGKPDNVINESKKKNPTVTKRQLRRDSKNIADAILRVGDGDEHRQKMALVATLQRKDLASHNENLQKFYPRSENSKFLERVGSNVIETTRELREMVRCMSAGFHPQNSPNLLPPTIRLAMAPELKRRSQQKIR